MIFLRKKIGPLVRIYLFFVILSFSGTFVRCDLDDQIYHNQFAVLVPKGKQTADQVASAHGFVNLGQIGSLDNYFLFENSRLQKRSTEVSDEHEKMLAVEPDVAW